jgi:hypothetical protein
MPAARQFLPPKEKPGQGGLAEKRSRPKFEKKCCLVSFSDAGHRLVIDSQNDQAVGWYD